MDRQAREAVSGQFFALDPIALNSDEDAQNAQNSDQKFRCNFRDYFGEFLQLFWDFT